MDVPLLVLDPAFLEAADQSFALQSCSSIKQVSKISLSLPLEKLATLSLQFGLHSAPGGLLLTSLQLFLTAFLLQLGEFAVLLHDPVESVLNYVSPQDVLCELIKLRHLGLGELLDCGRPRVLGCAVRQVHHIVFIDLKAVRLEAIVAVSLVLEHEQAHHGGKLDWRAVRPPESEEGHPAHLLEEVNHEARKHIISAPKHPEEAREVSQLDVLGYLNSFVQHGRHDFVVLSDFAKETLQLNRRACH